jgi:hypothetical protein
MVPQPCDEDDAGALAAAATELQPPEEVAADEAEGAEAEAADDDDTDDDAEEDDAEAESLTWDCIRSNLELKDAKARQFLNLFEEACSIDSPSTAFAQIKYFLGSVLVQDFDYKAFCQAVGSVDDRTVEDQDRWAAHLSKSLAGDLSAAASLMLRLAMAIAKAYSLSMSDWGDVNAACGSAIRVVPACYQLQHALPGALNDARSLRCLPVPSTDGGSDLNPWKSSEGRDLFERHHGVEWRDMENFTSEDGKPKACFGASLEILEVTRMEGLAFVRLRVERPGPAPAYARPKDLPAKDMEPDDVVLWEVDDEPFGALLEPGLVLEADWCELENEICFMSALESVTPKWAL